MSELLRQFNANWPDWILGSIKRLVFFLFLSFLFSAFVTAIVLDWLLRTVYSLSFGWQPLLMVLISGEATSLIFLGVIFFLFCLALVQRDTTIMIPGDVAPESLSDLGI
ncbi:MAG: hypothetical protein M1150_01485 [Patescibacteria group bacterium]|nr:hypothetical protein [Patescibacteria group bacterium]